MFTEGQLERYADVLLWGLKTARRGRFKKNDQVAIRYHLPAVRLAEILFGRLLEIGLHPIQQLLPTPYMERRLYHQGSRDQITFIPPGEDVQSRALNGNIMLLAPQSITHLADVDSGKIGESAMARKPVRDILNQREAAGDYSWTLCALTTKAQADQAKLSQKQHAEQIVKACFLDRSSPVARWEHIFEEAAVLKRWLNSMDVRYYHVESAHIDLKITPGKRRQWVGISGRNIPSFELFVSPDWRGTEGIFVANQSSFRSGNLVQNVRLEFKAGNAVNISATKGEKFTIKQLAMDSGSARLGEFSLTDKRFSRIDRFMANTLYDENYGGEYGNCHVALGSSYANTYDGDPKTLTPALKKTLGFNDSALHWDLVNTEPKCVTAHLKGGGQTLIYENGQFLY